MRVTIALLSGLLTLSLRFLQRRLCSAEASDTSRVGWDSTQCFGNTNRTSSPAARLHMHATLHH